MGLIPHLVRHDIRSQRLPLAVFAAFLCAEAALQVSGPVAYPAVFSGPWIPIVRSLLTVVIAALIVQQDSLVGTTAFWRTRPVGRLTLCAAKITSLALSLVLLPAMVMGLAWAGLGLHGRDALAAAGAVAVEQATVVLFTLMAAIVTPTLTFLVVAGVAGITMVTLFNGVLLPALMTSWPFVGQALHGYRPAVYLAAVFALGVPIVVHQYVTLRDWRTAAMVGIALLAATTVTRLWPDTGSETRPVDTRAVDPARVAVSLPADTLHRIETTDRLQGMPVRRVRYSTAILAAGQPDGIVLWRDGVDSRLLLRDRTLTFSAQTSGFAPRPDATLTQDPWRLAMNAALYPARLIERPALAAGEGARPVLRDQQTLVAVPLDVDRAQAGQRAVLASDVRLSAGRERIVAAVPVRPGARFAAPGFAGEILSVETTGRRVGMRMSITGVQRYRAAASTPLGAGPMDVRFVLRNASRREAVATVTARGAASEATLGISGTRTMRFVGERVFAAPPGLAGAPPLDAAWLAGAELVCLQLEYLGSFTRPAQVEFVVGERAVDGRQ